MTEWHCTVDGRQYGPVDEEGLRAWVAQGRLKPTDLVWTEGMAEWVQANAAAELSDVFAPGGVVPPPIAPSAYSNVSPFGTKRLPPHRGAAVLTLGILGIMPCCICGIIAWSMGNTDLREIDAGRMDPSGRGLTIAGRICGIVGVAIWSMYGVIWLIQMAIFGSMMHAFM